MDILEECIRQDEGEVLMVYSDSNGHPTCGIGHHLYMGSPIPQSASEAFLKQDIAIATSEFYRIPRTLTRHLNKARARVITCMIFNMGLPSVLTFHDMWAAVEREDWPAAKAAMLNSAWHNQVGKRAERLAEIMLNGKWPGEA